MSQAGHIQQVFKHCTVVSVWRMVSMIHLASLHQALMYGIYLCLRLGVCSRYLSIVLAVCVADSDRDLSCFTRVKLSTRYVLFLVFLAQGRSQTSNAA